MQVRRRNFLLLMTVAAAAAMTALGQTVAAVGPIDRAAHNAASIPDFSGMWAHQSIPGFEPLASGPTSLTNRSRRDGISNTLQLVGDYTNPILKPEAAEIVKKHGEMSLSHFGYPTPRNQCWPGGVPFVLSTNGLQIFQQPDKITILYAVDHQVRHVRMDTKHPGRVAPSWYGDSVGHYEGDTLVIDTIRVKVGPFAMVDWYGTPHSQALHVIERYRLLDYEAAKDGLERDAKENFGPRIINSAIEPFDMDRNYRGKYLQLLFTVEDEGVFTTPWSATVTYGRPLGEWLENVCAENPHKYGTEKDVAVPTADKPDF
jgi:hypothetical protein